MFTFATPRPTGTSCQAHFYTWTQLSELCSTLLTGFFERPTPVQAVGETSLDSWSLKFLEAPISHDDLEAIFTALQADDYDRDVNDIGKCPAWELSQALSQRLVSPTLPFPVDASHASDDGIWFTGVAMYARQQYEGRNYETSRNQTEGVI